MPEREHIVRSFEAELRRLGVGVRETGELALAQFRESIAAVVERDDARAAAVVAGDARIDASERELQLAAVRLLALRQPMAVDLREAMAAIKIASDLERIGDLAKSIAKRATVLNQYPPHPVASRLGRMGEAVATQIREVLAAYAERDAERAEGVWRGDRVVDDWYDSVFRELLTYMMEDPRSITASAHLLFVAKNVERVGDHCANVAAEVRYRVEGEAPAEERPKGADARLADVRGGPG